MEMNIDTILHKINNVLQKYRDCGSMTLEEIQLAMTSQWLRISEFSQRPLILQLKLFCTILQFTILSKDQQQLQQEEGKGPKFLGNYCGKLLNVIPLNSILWHHVQNFGISIVQIILDIAQTGIYQSHSIALNFEGSSISSTCLLIPHRSA